MQYFKFQKEMYKSCVGAKCLTLESKVFICLLGRSKDLYVYRNNSWKKCYYR